MSKYCSKLICLVFWIGLVGCKSKQLLVLHETLPEEKYGNVPTGVFNEQQCLETGRKYAIQLTQSIIYGDVLYIRQHNKLKRGHIEALKPDDTVQVLVEKQVSFTTNCRNGPRESIIDYVHVNDTDSASANTYKLCMRDTTYITTIHHSEILSFKQIKDKRYNLPDDCITGPLVEHTLLFAGQPHEDCPINIDQLYLFITQQNQDTSYFNVIVGEITDMPYTIAGSTLTIFVRNEKTEHCYKGYPDFDKILKVLANEYPFPENFTPYEKKIKHEEIKYFIPACSLQGGSEDIQHKSQFWEGTKRFLTGYLGAMFVLFIFYLIGMIFWG